MNHALKKAIDILGGQNRAAATLHCSQSMVHYWLNKSKHGVPAEYCPTIEELTNGQVTAKKLRPDIFGRLTSRSKQHDHRVATNPAGRRA